MGGGGDTHTQQRAKWSRHINVVLSLANETRRNDDCLFKRRSDDLKSTDMIFVIGQHMMVAHLGNFRFFFFLGGEGVVGGVGLTMISIQIELTEEEWLISIV